MKKLFSLIFISFFLNNCSFDNKTGIWTGSDQVVKKKDDSDIRLVPIFKKNNDITEKKDLSLYKQLKFGNLKKFTNWSQRFQNNSNNISNVSFLNNGNYKKFSKISNTAINNNILVYNDNLIFSDIKGNIGIFSLSQNQLKFKFNFYKKKIKKTKKDIKLIINDKAIIAVDNLGYVYSIDYNKNKINWAKNYLVPFRSNLKIINEILFLSDEQNKIILIDIKNGKKVDELYTQPSKTVSKFKSNLAVDKNKNLLFLSTSGSLYSLNLLNQKTINWIQNFKPESEIVFNANPIVISNEEILISTSNNISLINQNGSRIWDKKIKLDIPPVISGSTIFLINKENYLMLIDKNNGEVIFSNNLNTMIDKDFKKNFKRKIKKIKYIFLTNNKLLLVSENSYFIEIKISNKVNINSIKKNPFTISSDIIFIEKEMIFVSDSKRVYKVN